MKNRFIFKVLLSSFLILSTFLVAGTALAAVPTAPGSLSLYTADDTGVDNDASTTQTTGLTIMGSKDADSAIRLFDFFGGATTTIGFFPVDANLAWGIDVDLAVGTHLLSAIATSTGGESATSTRFTLQITAQPTVDLLTADDFTILAETGVTDATPASTAITGNVGVSTAAGSTITGLSCTKVNGFIYTVDPTYTGGYDSNVSCLRASAGNKTTVDQAVLDMGTAYTAAAGSPRGTGATYLNVGLDAGTATLSGNTFYHGTYTWYSNVSITNDITLSGSATDKWIFQVNGTLSIEANKKINLTGGALPANIFWQVTGATTLKTGATFEGTILDQTSIALQLGTVLHGRALAQTAVTLIGSTVSSGSGDTSAPTITPISITSSNASSTLAKIGDVITISFTSSKALAVATSTVNGLFTAVIATTSPTTFTATYTMTSASSDGTITFKIGTKDLAGNYSAQAVAITSGSNVTFDKTAPVITIAGTNPLTINYRSAYTDEGASASDSRDGSLTSSMTTTNSVVTTTVGAQTVTYSATDTAGNSTTETRTVTVSAADSGGVISGGGGSYVPFSFKATQTATPIVTNTTSEIMAQINALLAQIKVLQASAGLPTTTAYSVHGASGLSAGLKLGLRSGNVTALQKILAQDREIYPSGLVTGFFGSMTQKAVQAFQIKYGVVKSASEAGYGNVGPKTRAKLIEIFGN